jgi:hypothetical protein
MTAASSRAFIEEHGLGEHVQKIVADAPELTAAQRKTLHAIFVNATTAGLADPTAIIESPDAPDDIAAQA